MTAMPLALSAYSVVLALHIMAVVAAFGLPLAYPLLVPYVRRAHPGALGAVHDVQYRLNQRVTAPGTVLILLFGAYMASKEDLWGEVWVIVPLTILIVIGGRGGGARDERGVYPPLHDSGGRPRRARPGGHLLHGRQAGRVGPRPEPER